MVKKASSMLGCIRTSVTCRSVILHCSSLRPPLVYCTDYWTLQYTRHMNILGQHLDRNEDDEEARETNIGGSSKTAQVVEPGKDLG